MNLTLTNAAAEDVARILAFGIERFGLDRALAYFEGLERRFFGVADHPEQYSAVAHIRPGTRRCVHESHAIYFCIEAEGVLVVRVLVRQSPGAALALVEGEP